MEPQIRVDINAILELVVGYATVSPDRRRRKHLATTTCEGWTIQIEMVT
jgi:hypothetical protein